QAQGRQTRTGEVKPDTGERQGRNGEGAGQRAQSGRVDSNRNNTTIKKAKTSC
ncbi:hypothetical protein AJ78_07070, partial [Emergomyces pasteurianus Ep9510]